MVQLSVQHQHCLRQASVLSPRRPVKPTRSAACDSVASTSGRNDAFSGLGSRRRHGRFIISRAQPTATESRTSVDEELARVSSTQKLVKCGPTPLGRGLVCRNAVIKQCVVSVPLENVLCITDEPLDAISVFGDRCIERWQKEHGKLPIALLELLQGDARWDVRMTAWLLWVKTRLCDSPHASPIWRLYLSLLPSREDAPCLLNFSPKEAKELQLPSLIEEAKSQYDWATSVHSRYFSDSGGKLAALKLAGSEEDTLWAMSMVRTRTFSEAVNGEGITLMVPYADLANHSFTYNSTFCMAANNQRFELRSLQALNAEEEVTISYGEDKTNAETMRDYGFVVPGNPNDRITCLAPVELATTGADAASTTPQQRELPRLNAASLTACAGFSGDWRKADSIKPTLEATAAAEASGPGGAMRLARRRSALLSLPMTDGLGGAGASATSGSNGMGSSLAAAFGWPPKAWTDSGVAPPQKLVGNGQSEERVRALALRQVLQAELGSLPTTAEHDEQLLSSGQARGLHAAAVRCRLEHKLLLVEGVRLLDEYAACLDSVGNAT